MVDLPLDVPSKTLLILLYPSPSYTATPHLLNIRKELLGKFSIPRIKRKSFCPSLFGVTS